jgi:hypothetical protein
MALIEGIVMNRKELIELAKIHFDWESLFQKTNFRKVESSPDGDFQVWSRDTQNSKIEFFVSGEEEAALLDPSIASDKIRWEKLDFIQTFLVDSSWELLQEYVYSRDGLLDGPLLEMSQEIKREQFLETTKTPIEEKISRDPLFAKEYDRHLRGLLTRRAAELAIAQLDSGAVVNFLSLSKDEFAAQSGLIDWKKLWADENPEHWLVPGLICEGRGHACPAASGIGKSLLWLDVSAGLASGRSVLGYPAQESIKVLYLDHENTPKGDVKPRLQAMGYKPEDLENLCYLSFPNIEALNTKLGGESFCQLLDYFTPQFVVIDTFSRFVEGDENSSKVAQDFYEFAGRELKRRKIAYLRIDHIGKDASKGARGSSAKIDDLDLIWTMSKSKEPNVFILKNEKARVPIKEHKLALERIVDPLKHVIRTGSSWSELIEKVLKHETAVALIETLQVNEPKHSLAQGKVWKDLGPICKTKGISRDDLFEALKFVNCSNEEPIEETI